MRVETEIPKTEIYSNGNFFPLSLLIACSISISREKMGEASSGDFLTMVIDPVGHDEAHSPQPMHFSLLMTERSLSIFMACTLHRSTQVKQELQVSSSFSA